MIVMPANNSNAHREAERWPGLFGLLMSPDGRRNPKGLPWAIDNGMYSAWESSCYSTTKEIQREYWDGMLFWDLLEWAKNQCSMPRWVVAPDVPGNATETLREFDLWAPAIEHAGFNLAIAAQDGMTPKDIPNGVVCFIGGSTGWKHRNIEKFCSECERVHVARINGEKLLWRCYRAGAESVDGTGWYRGDQRQLAGLHRWADRVSAGLDEFDDEQLELFA